MATLSLKAPLALSAGLATVAIAPRFAREGDEPGPPYDENTTEFCWWWIDCEYALGFNCIDTKKFYHGTSADVVRWNGLNTGCTNFWAAAWACVKGL